MIVRLTAGGLWLLVLASIAGELGDATGAFWWSVPAGIVWVVLLKRTTSNALKRPHGALWFLASLFGPLSLLLLLVLFRPTQQASLSARTTEVADVSTGVACRLVITYAADRPARIRAEFDPKFDRRVGSGIGCPRKS